MANSEAEMKRIPAVRVMEQEDVYEAIVAHKDQLYGIAYSYLRNRNDALEAIQEMTCRALAKRRSLRNPESFKPWIVRILIYICIDEQRRRKRSVPAAEPIPEESADPAGFRKLDLQWALDQLKAKHRNVLLLRYYNDLTISDIAEVLGKPEGTIKTWLHKGLKQLRSIMQDRRDWDDGES